MEFKPLYYKEKLSVLNPFGDVGVVTLWSPVKTVQATLSRTDRDLVSVTSRIAAMGTLYGHGIPELLRNLLYNPQIRHLVIIGKGLSDSRQALLRFFSRGIHPVSYLGTTLYGIVGTDHTIDGDVTPDDFAGRLSLTDLTSYRDAPLHDEIRRFFQSLPPWQPCRQERIHRPLPAVQIAWYPSDPRGHTITRPDPLQAWRELIFRLVRFGHRNRLAKGERWELQNVKVVVETPIEATERQLAEHGFSLEALHRYQASLLDASPPAEQPYAYGHRLRGHFHVNGRCVDALASFIARFKADPETRHAYTSLWDSSRDSLPETKGCPCLVSLFFRKFGHQLTLTATFRTHNALDGWLKNLYGLMAVQRYVAERLSMPVGPISVISHSVTIDPQGGGLARARAIAEAKESDDAVDPRTGRRSLRLDPNGAFMVTTDEEAGELVVQHRHNGQLLKEYRARRPESLEKRLLRDGALSELSHALYLGREMARQSASLEHALRGRGGHLPSVSNRGVASHTLSEG